MSLAILRDRLASWKRRLKGLEKMGIGEESYEVCSLKAEIKYLIRYGIRSEVQHIEFQLQAEHRDLLNSSPLGRVKKSLFVNPKKERAAGEVPVRDSVWEEYFSAQPNSREDSLLDQIQDYACNLMMPYEPSPEGRLVGLEFEVAGINRQDGKDIIAVASRDWKVISDGSIPSMGAEAECECDLSPRCNECDEHEHRCDCCFCTFECENCCYENTINGWPLTCPVCEENAPRGMECEGNCFDRNCYEPECECEYDEEFPGMEIVSPPGKTEAFFAMAEKIYNRAVLTASNNHCEHSAKDGDCATGYHVHVDARDLSPEQSALCIPALESRLKELQSQFPSILPDWRIEDFYYCQLVNAAGKKKLPDLFKDQHDSCRYKAVNLNSLRKHSTVEFRIGFMPDTGREAIEWAKYLRDLVNEIARINPKVLSTSTVAEGLDLIGLKDYTSWDESEPNLIENTSAGNALKGIKQRNVIEEILYLLDTEWIHSDWVAA